MGLRLGWTLKMNCRWLLLRRLRCRLLSGSQGGLPDRFLTFGGVRMMKSGDTPLMGWSLTMVFCWHRLFCSSQPPGAHPTHLLFSPFPLRLFSLFLFLYSLPTTIKILSIV